MGKTKQGRRERRGEMLGNAGKFGNFKSGKCFLRGFFEFLSFLSYFSEFWKKSEKKN
jgi:hypothetical protein